MKLLKANSKKEQLSADEIQERTVKKTAQDWMPLKDITNGLAYNKENYIVGYLVIEPFNLDLYNSDEQANKIGELAEALNGEDQPFIWYATDRPADIEPYLDDLKHKADISNKSIKKILLGKYSNTARNQVISGELVEKKFYMAVRVLNDKKAELILRQRLTNIQTSLSSVGLQVKIGNDKNVYELFSIFSDPSSSMFDSGNYNDGDFPQYKGE